MPKCIKPNYRNLAEKFLYDSQTSLVVSFDAKTGKYGIWDRETGCFRGSYRWTRRKDALDYLAISVVLGKI